MKYVFANIIETKPSVNIMKKYISMGKEIKCFIGEDYDARIIKRDSVIMSLTDPDALFDNCLYPLFLEGKVDVKSLLKRNLDLMIASNNVVYIFQAVRILFTQIKYEKMYESLPFKIDITEYLFSLNNLVEDKRNEMETYKEGEFSKFRRNMYQQSINMLKKCIS